MAGGEGASERAIEAEAAETLAMALHNFAREVRNGELAGNGGGSIGGEELQSYFACLLLGNDWRGGRPVHTGGVDPIMDFSHVDSVVAGQSRLGYCHYVIIASC